VHREELPRRLTSTVHSEVNGNCQLRQDRDTRTRHLKEWELVAQHFDFTTASDLAQVNIKWPYWPSASCHLACAARGHAALGPTCITEGASFVSTSETIGRRQFLSFRFAGSRVLNCLLRIPN
jgi:hypothetical protein